jgi:hypothetical protein
MNILTQRQAANQARRIPFDTKGINIVPYEVTDGLWRIVRKQLRRIAVRPMAEQTRAALREQLGCGTHW